MISAKPSRAELEKIGRAGLVVVSMSRGPGQGGREEEALASTLKAYLARKDPGDDSAIAAYIARYPEGSWTPGLRITKGVHAYHEGRFSEALEDFEQAWAALKSSQDPKVREASVSAAAELAGLYARLGRFEDLGILLREIEGRPVSGPATEKIRMAAEGLESMTRFPEHSYKCGPFALRSIRDFLNLQPATHPLIDQKESTPEGISMAELQTLAGNMEMDWVAASRQPGAQLPLPALVHWKVGHYAAVLKKTGDGRLLVRDPTFLHDFLIAPDVFDRESSGRFLIPRTSLGKGWVLLPGGDAAKTYGKGAPTSKDSDDSNRDGTCPEKGMTFYSFDFFKAGLVLQDIPLGYVPPYGPAIDFHLTYNQRGEQVLDASLSSLGPKWTTNWSSYLQQSDSAGNVVLFLRDGRRETHFWNSTAGQFNRQKRSQTHLVRVSTSPLVYERRNADGSKETYSRVVSASPYHKVLLTGISDPQGNTVTLGYDASNRLTVIADALGQTSNFYYENSSFPNLVTKISDPFIVNGQRRSAIFAYTTAGRLAKITDPEGIESAFIYDSVQPDFVSRLTTPYGSTTFTTNPATAGDQQFVEVTDPLGRKERVEYRHSFQNILLGSDPAGEIPDSGLIQSKNNYLYYGNTLHWDKKTYAHHPPNPQTGLNYDKAVCRKWIWHATVSYRPIGVVSSIKKPFESRIWYQYPGQMLGTYGILIGDSEQPSKIGRRLENNETQVDQYEYNTLGNLTRHTDSLGRARVWQYDALEVDLQAVKQQNGANDEILASFTYDPADPPRRPRTLTDAAGQTTTLSWNSRGQILSQEQPGALITTWNYNTAGYLTSWDGPLPGVADTVSYTYDVYGRLRTLTRPGSHTLTYDYDALDRPTLITYPDASTEQFAYERANGDKILDLTHFKDRENRWTLFAYNALRERVGMIDPLQRGTTYNWCYCGALQDLYDAEGNHTHWDYDIGGRLIRKKYPDNSEHLYDYDLAGRPDTVTDAKAQVKTLSYYRDNRLAGITYANAENPTANVAFTYDPVYGRLSQMTDGIGITTYTYHPVDGSTLGAGNLNTEDGPLVDDTIALTYDALGRLKSRSINGTANTMVIDTYDALGRVEQLTNSLGAFTYAYHPVNLKLQSVTAPNGLTTGYSYYANTGDLRLQGIEHQAPGATPLSSHAYTYSPAGKIKTWAQSMDGAAIGTWDLGYDRADQLENASFLSTGGAPAVLKQHAWRYDRAGNRTIRQNGSQVIQSAHNNLNQLTSEEGGGWMRVRGQTNEPANVTVKSNLNPPVAAATDSANNFSAWVEVESGLNTIAIKATDVSPNANPKTNQYEVTVTGNSRTTSYDLNGNMTNNGAGQTYAWDAENRLVKITYSDNSRTEFSYDGCSRRVRIIEKNSSNAVTGDKRYLWCDGNQPSEERDGTGDTVLKQFHTHGVYVPAAASPANKLFYTKDHLGSIRELVDNNGGTSARYSYDSWGKRSKESGSVDADIGYTGHFEHAPSGLILTWYRAYDPTLGRWLSRDPIGEAGGGNLYGYVGNAPVKWIDSLGLFPANFIQDYEGRFHSTPTGYTTAGYDNMAVSPQKPQDQIDQTIGQLLRGEADSGVDVTESVKYLLKQKAKWDSECRKSMDAKNDEGNMPAVRILAGLAGIVYNSARGTTPWGAPFMLKSINDYTKLQLERQNEVNRDAMKAFLPP